MGTADRDYMKEEARRYDGGGGGGMGMSEPWPPVVKWLLIANIACFVGQLFMAEFTNWFAYHGASVLKGQIWRLLTASFLHSTDNVFHIVFNMLMLVMIGRVLEKQYGSREFLAFYLCAAVFSNLFWLGIELLVGSFLQSWGLGASGAVMGIFLLFAVHYPRAKILLFFVFPVEVRWLLLAFVVWDVGSVLIELSTGRTFDNIGHAAHTGGLLFGWLYWKFSWVLRSMIPSRLVPSALPPASSVTSFGGVPPRASIRPKSTRKPKATQLKVDEILDKVSEHGLHSLTEKERRFLEKASDDMKG